MAGERIDSSSSCGRALKGCAALAVLLWPVAAGADDPARRQPTGVLVLTNGDRLPGTLAAAEKSSEIVWQSPAFGEPFRFPLARVQVVTFDTTSTEPKSNFRLELSDGGQIQGDLVALDQSEIVLKTTQATLRVKRTLVASLGRGPPGTSKRRAGPVAVEKLVVDQSRAVLTDGKIIYGKLTAFDAQSWRFSFKSWDKTLTIPAADVAEFVLAEPRPSNDPAQLEYSNGTRLRGELQRLGDGKAVFKSPALVEDVALPLAGLRRIRVSSPTERPPRRSGEAVLSVDGGRLHGRLVATAPQAGQTGLAWKASASSEAAAIRRGAVVSIDFGAPGVRDLVEDETGRGDRIFLRGGDVLRCTVERIGADETTVNLAGSVSTTFPNAHLKAVEFGPHALGEIPADELARLLTLPRLQKHGPPTHIVTSRRDDFLRGRLIAADESHVVFEAGGVRRELLRRRIASIIWLNADEDPRSSAAATDVVRATDVDGLTLTLRDVRLDGGCLVGRHELLGECRLPLDRLSKLNLGAAKTRPGRRDYAQWKLTDAIVPAAFADEVDNTIDGHARNSDLVGRPAPDCTLELLDGTKFELSKELGKPVVLDFWASWCAPCMKSLPEMAALADGFDSGKVRFVAVNLQESDDDVRRAVERLGLKLRVGLDRDGQVAVRYGVGAIPCTVVVGADGKVARVFVGAGPRMAEELKAAIAGKE